MKRIPILIVLVTLSLAAFGQEKPRQATLAQQKMCAEQAKKIFHEDNPTRPKDALTWQYTSHYEARTNVCYMMTWVVTVSEKSTTISHAVYDAFEGREYASFMQVGEHVMDCSVSPPGQDSLDCKTNGEFQRLVDKHFGIGR